MSRHVKPLTYAPKIAGVRDGSIRQTIRPYNEKKPVKVGDTILFYGWEGVPYRGKWGWRKEVEVTGVVDVIVMPHGFGVEGGTFYKWSSAWADLIAALDGIDPPTGIALGKLFLTGKYKVKPGTKLQIIRW